MPWIVFAALSALMLIVASRIRKKSVTNFDLLIAAFFLGSVFILHTWGWLGQTLSFRFSTDASPVFQFTSHPYGQVVAMGLILTGIPALIFGFRQASAREQILGLLAILSAIGVCYSADFITLFFFWEMITILTTGLVFCNTQGQDTCPVFPLGLRYLAMHIGGGVLLLFGILLHYQQSGSFMIAAPEAGLIFFVLGIGLKAAFIPLHVWILWGYPNASLFSSVVLAGISTKIGVYAIARILPASDFIVMMGASMAVFGVIAALIQKNLRKLLSYHIISQVGYMVAAASLGTALAVDGALLHVVNHMLYKSLLFMSAGTVLHCIGTEDIPALIAQNPGDHHGESPVWKLLPIAFAGALIGSLAIAGFPLFNGYVSKYLLKNAFSGTFPAAAMLTLASVGTAASFSKFIWFGFIRARGRLLKKPSSAMIASMMFTSGLCILLGVRPDVLHNLLPYASSLAVYNLAGILSAAALTGAGIVIFIPMSKAVMSSSVTAWFTAFSIESLIFKRAIPACTRFPNQVWCALEEKSGSSYRRLAEYLIATLVLLLLTVMLFAGR
jgi:multicomponent Na+:H+ antiporter subunit D